MRRFILPLIALIAIPELRAAAEPMPAPMPSRTQESEIGSMPMAPLVLSQSIDEESGEESDEEQNLEDAWRVYLDLYAFLVPTTYTTTEVNGNRTNSALPLSDVINTLDEALTFKAQVEYGRIGFMAGVYHGSLSDSQSASFYNETSNPLRNRLDLPSRLRKRTLRVEGDLDLEVDANQTVVDLAFRYRGGAIQKPRMEKGSSSFIGLVGARIIDANIRTNFTLNNESTLSVEGRRVNRELTRELKKSSSESYGNTWAQPLIGVFGTYAISEDWQAFAYLDAGGFGLSGEQDLSGTAQAGIAYALGNSAQISLSYKYFGLDYAGGGGNSYSVDQSGVNLGLRWLFD
ncbi:MAG: hypothetical protein CBC50_08685 [Synechococcus sp. TMED90]|nr:MAG: hypothetical protein CBC50_08685 [Synechococcus sp. TMED90]